MNDLEDDTIVETYWVRDETGKVKQIDFATTCRRLPEKYTPVLEFSEKWAEYFKWKNEKLIKNEMRWGKDDLRKRGFESTKVRNEAGKLVTIYALPQPVEAETE